MIGKNMQQNYEINLLHGSRNKSLAYHPLNQARKIVK